MCNAGIVFVNAVPSRVLVRVLGPELRRVLSFGFLRVSVVGWSVEQWEGKKTGKLWGDVTAQIVISKI